MLDQSFLGEARPVTRCVRHGRHGPMTLSIRPFFKLTLLGRPTLLSDSDKESVYADMIEVVTCVQWEPDTVRALASSSLPGVFIYLQ